MEDTLKEIQNSRTKRRSVAKGSREGTARTNAAQSQLTPTAGSASGYAGRVAAERSSANSLAKALSSLSPSLNRLADVKQNNIDNEILAQADARIEQIKQEAGTDVVSRVQVGELVPEASATVTAKLTQAMGSQYASEQWKTAFEAIESDDNLRLNTQARNAYLKEFKEELSQASKDPFYLSGMLKSYEAEVARQEAKWVEETATYHKQILEQEHIAELTDLVRNGGDVATWEREASTVSALTGEQLKKLTVNTVTALAIETDDKNLLEKIPDTFMTNADRLLLAKTKDQIESNKWSKQEQAWKLQERRRVETERNAKLAMMKEFNETGYINPSEQTDPVLNAFAYTLSQRDRVPKVSSVQTATLLRDGILKASLSGDVNDGLAQVGYYGDFSLDGISTWVLENPDVMNTEDATKLIEDLPKLLEGRALMQQPRITDTYNRLISPSIKGLRDTPNVALQERLTGFGFETTVNQFYYDEIAEEFESYRDASPNNDWPKRGEQNRIIKDVRERTLKLIADIANAGSSKEFGEAVEDAREATVDEDGVIVFKGYGEDSTGVTHIRSREELEAAPPQGTQVITRRETQ